MMTVINRAGKNKMFINQARAERIESSESSPKLSIDSNDSNSGWVWPRCWPAALLDRGEGSPRDAEEENGREAKWSET